MNNLTSEENTEILVLLSMSTLDKLQAIEEAKTRGWAKVHTDTYIKHMRDGIKLNDKITKKLSR